MSDATTLTTPSNQVDDLIKQVADENGLELISQLNEAEAGTSIPAESSRTREDEQDLSRRWAEAVPAVWF